MKDIIIITGPTASGKSDLAIELAQALDGEIISADSVQIYKYFDIGSGKISKKEQNLVPHYLIDILEPNENFSVKDFQEQAFVDIENIIKNQKIPIICGGTMLYIHSILYNLQFIEEKYHDETREKLEKKYNEEGLTVLLEELKLLNPKIYNEIDQNNPRRVIRAIERIKTGQDSHNNFRELNPKYSFHYFILDWDRETLYNRINKRVDKMIQKGLFSETEWLYKEYGMVKPMTTIGYKEIVEFLENRYTYEKSIEKIKQHSRNYAKRQLTWFRREGEAIPISMTEKNPLQNIINNLNERRDK